jgi:hypothetical protein
MSIASRVSINPAYGVLAHATLALMCRVCKAPKEVLESINAQLRQKPKPVPMHKIAEACGISKAEIGRHSLQCVPRETLKTHGTFSRAPRYWVDESGQMRSWPGQELVNESDLRGPVTVFTIRRQGQNQTAIVARQRTTAIELNPFPCMTHEQAKALAAEMAERNQKAIEAETVTLPPSIEEAAAPETETGFVIVRKPEEEKPAPEAERKLTPRQSERYKWLHAPLGMKHD